MLHIPEIDNYLKILTDEEVKNFVARNFNILNLYRKNKILEKFLNRFISF